MEFPLCILEEVCSRILPIGSSADLCRERNQPAADGMIPHDSGMVGDVGGRGDSREKFGQGAASSDLLQVALALKQIADG